MKWITWIDSTFTTAWRKIRPIALFLCIGVNTALAQTIKTQSVYSAGTTTNAAVGGGYMLYASVGQPIALQTTPLTATTTNAGFMQVVNTIIGDNQSPVLQLSGSPLLVKDATNSLTISVTDNYNVNESSVTLHYRKISGKDFTETLMSKTTGTEFNKVVDASWYDAMGLEYYFTAKDVTANEGRSPLDPLKYHQLYFKDTNVVLPFDNFGKEQKDYRILSVPYNTSSKDVNKLFADFAATDNTKFRMWKYENSDWKEFPNFKITQGEGFFVIVSPNLSDKTLSMGTQTAPTNNRAELFEMTLKPGWNLIGNPYTVPINWEDVQTLNENATVPIIISDLKIYTGSTTNNGYNNAVDVAPFQGGFLHLDESADQTITIPFKGQTAPGGRKAGERFSSNLGADQWRVDLTVAKGDLSNGLAGFGMHPKANVTKDRYDDLNPPHFEQFVEVNFSHAEHALKNFCRDVVETQTEYVWNFTVNAETSEETSLAWNNADFGNNTNELFLYNEVTNEAINMRSENTYTFKGDKSTAFKVYFGIDVLAKIKPERLFVSAPYPNPLSSANSLTFDLALPDNANAYTVHIDIINTQGLKIGSHQKPFKAGREKFEIDLTLNNLSSGIYIYRITISSSNIQQVVNGKLIVR